MDKPTATKAQPTPEPAKGGPPNVPKSSEAVPAQKAPSSPNKKAKSGSHNYYKPIVARATNTKANRVIIISVGATAGVILLARVSGSPSSAKLNDPGDLLRLALGAGFTIIFLMIIAEASPDIAIGLSMIIGLGALLTYGGDFGKAVMNGTLKPGKVVPK